MHTHGRPRALRTQRHACAHRYSRALKALDVHKDEEKAKVMRLRVATRCAALQRCAVVAGQDRQGCNPQQPRHVLREAEELVRARTHSQSRSQTHAHEQTRARLPRKHGRHAPGLLPAALLARQPLRKPVAHRSAVHVALRLQRCAVLHQVGDDLAVQQGARARQGQR
jgi:hypothetical protein